MSREHSAVHSGLAVFFMGDKAFASLDNLSSQFSRGGGPNGPNPEKIIAFLGRTGAQPAPVPKACDDADE